MSTSHMLSVAQELEHTALRQLFGTIHKLRLEYVHPDCWAAHELRMTEEICRRVADEIRDLLVEKTKEHAEAA
jgi:hypothetical protein